MDEIRSFIILSRTWYIKTGILYEKSRWSRWTCGFPWTTANVNERRSVKSVVRRGRWGRASNNVRRKWSEIRERTSKRWEKGVGFVGKSCRHGRKRDRETRPVKFSSRLFPRVLEESCSSPTAPCSTVLLSTVPSFFFPIRAHTLALLALLASTSFTSASFTIFSFF